MYIFEARYNKRKKTKELIFDCEKTKQSPITLDYCNEKCNKKDKCKHMDKLIEKQKLENMEEMLVAHDFKEYYISIGAIFTEYVKVFNPDTKELTPYCKMLVPKKY